MITIFVLLAIGFLGGGAFAIVDGWPYLVLERGFTQVIVGTVAVTAGVILLALSRLLVEMRRLKALLLASAPALAMQASPMATASFDPAPASFDAGKPGVGPGAIAAGAGLVAAGGALAIVMADDRAAGPGQADDHSEPAVGDLFDKPLAAGASADPAADPAAAADEALHADSLWLHEMGHAAATPDPAPAAITAAIHAAFEVAPDASAAPEPEAARPEAAPAIWWPEVERDAADEIEQEAPATDDLSSLRRHLTLGPLRPERADDAASHDPPERRGGDEIGVAAAWMEPVFARREPTFDAHEVFDAPETVAEDAEAGRTQPGWAEAVSHDVVQDAPADVDAGDEAGRGESIPPTGADAAGPGAAVPLPVVPAEPATPAASDEGVVGAYQVGDTQFTMYADGSIQARTPDGDYDFASMDELKTYLASEKSRLGA